MPITRILRQSEKFSLIKLLTCFLLLITVALAEESWVEKTQREFWATNPKFPKEPLPQPEPTSKDAYLYMYCSRPGVDSDLTYFHGLLMTIYRLSILNKYYDHTPRDIIVSVCDYTEQWQIDTIKTLGVFVIPISTIIPSGSISGNSRYIDQFAKIQLWRLTKWERLLYTDIDTTYTPEGIKIWDEPAAQIKTTPPPTSTENVEYYPYLFAAVQDFPCRLHACDPKDYYFSAGVFMIKPDLEYYERLINKMNMNDISRGLMEQDLFNWFFRTGGPCPVARLPAKYNSHYDFESEMHADVGIIHCKLWGHDYDHIRHMFNNWWDDFRHVFEKKPLSLARVYDKDDVFYINSTNKEAYLFLFNEKAEEDRFMAFEAFRLSILKIKELEKDNQVKRDIIIVAVEGTSKWQLQELQRLTRFVIVLKHMYFNNNPADLLKVMFWKLINWNRILYINHGIFINDKQFVNIWNEKSTQLVETPKKDYQEELHKVPAENVKYFYPYVFAVTQDSKTGNLNPSLFMFKPCITHYNYLRSLLDTIAIKDEQGLFKNIYNLNGPIPYSVLDDSYNIVYLSTDIPTNKVKAYNDKDLWSKNGNLFYSTFWDSYYNATFESDVNPFAPVDTSRCPVNCKSCSNPSTCGTCEDGYEMREMPYMECPAGTQFGSFNCKTLSSECDDCIKKGVDTGKCQSCKSGIGLDNNEYYCTVGTSSRNVPAYCSPCENGGCNYVAKGSMCVKVMPGRGGDKLVPLLLILAIVLCAGFALWKMKDKLKLKYVKMENSRAQSADVSDNIDTA